MSLSLNNSTIVPLLSNGSFLGKGYDNILDFAEINISIKCDVGYTLTYIYSQDKLTVDYDTSQVIDANIETQFYKIPVNDRYFRLKVDATDGDMTVLNVQTIYKSVPTFNNSGSCPTSNVAITGPLNGDGSVRVGGSLTLGGSVDANITNSSLDVDITNSELTVVNSQLDKLSFDSLDNLNINLNSVNSSFIDNDGLRVSVVNASIPVSGSVSVSNFPATQQVSNGSLASMSFDTNRLNVLDSDANTKLTNIYNIVNSRGQAQMLNGTALTAVELPNVKSCTIYGNVSGATILTVQFSPNGIDFYSSQYSVNMTGTGGDFGFVIDGLCAKWIMLNNSNNVNGVAFVDYC